MNTIKLRLIVSGVVLIFSILVGIANKAESDKEVDMKLLDRLFKKKHRPDTKDDRSVEEMREDPNLIQVYDAYGREMFIDKETWRKDVLPGNIKNSWGNPDELYGVIINALDDGNCSDVVKAAYQLYEIDHMPERGACVLAIVLMKNRKNDKAESVLKSFIEKHGETGVILTNLAKVYAEQGDDTKSDETLWRGLQLDPNQDNAVEWFAANHNDKSGHDGYINALEKISALKGSWRAQMWLARESLEKKDFPKALEYYNHIVSTLEVIPAEVMMHISGDLGNAGRLENLVELFGKRFNPELHGLMVGNNLLKAYIELGDTKSAQSILDSLYKMNRPDWKEHLAFWDNQLDMASGKYGATDKDKEFRVTSLTLEWPVWAHKLSSLDSLLPEKTDDAPSIAFISASCEYQDFPDSPKIQKTDKEGSLCRAIPLFISEQIHMTTTAKSAMFIPIISGEGSFLMSSQPWEIEALADLAAGSNADFVWGSHLIAKGDEWELVMNFIHVRSKKLIETFTFDIDANDPASDIMKLSDEIRKVASDQCGLKEIKAPVAYRLPAEEIMNYYLDATSQSLAMTVATSDQSGSDSLYGERSILDCLLDLVLRDANSDIAQLMFIGGLAKNKSYGSDIYLEYKTKAEKLVDDIPLSGVAGDVVKETLVSLYKEENK